jgi:hypothetical protein
MACSRKNFTFTFTFMMCTGTYCLAIANLSPDYSFSFRLSQFVPRYPTSPQRKTTIMCKSGSSLQILNPKCSLSDRNKVKVKLFLHWIKTPDYEGIYTVVDTDSRFFKLSSIWRRVISFTPLLLLSLIPCIHWIGGFVGSSASLVDEEK